MRSQAGTGVGAALSGTQPRSPTLPGSPNQQTLKGSNKMVKGTVKPMGATLPVSALHCTALCRISIACQLRYAAFALHAVALLVTDVHPFVTQFIPLCTPSLGQHYQMSCNHCTSPVPGEEGESS